MLKVTATAKEKLREALADQQTKPGFAARLIPSKAKQHEYELALDKEKEKDQVVQSEDGEKILLIGPEIAPALDEMVFDYVKTDDGDGFTMTKANSCL